MSKRSVQDDIIKLRNLVPIINANQGISIDELLKISGFASEKDLVNAINDMIFFGVPPFTPGDFIDIEIDDERKVYLYLSQGLDRPLALTAAELALLHTILLKEEEVHGSQQNPSGLLRKIIAGIAGPTHSESNHRHRNRREIIDEALKQAKVLGFTYRSISSKEPEIRTVDPWVMITNRGYTYLIGHCHLRGSARSFHLERMEAISIVDQPRTTAPPDDLREIVDGLRLFDNRQAGFTVELGFAPDLQWPLQHRFGVELMPQGDAPGLPTGWKRGSCKVRESLWFRNEIRGFGDMVVILSPEHMRQSYLEELDELPIPLIET